MCVATIQGWPLFLLQSSMCGYYSRAATNQGVASIRINTVYCTYIYTCVHAAIYMYMCNHVPPFHIFSPHDYQSLYCRSFVAILHHLFSLLPSHQIQSQFLSNLTDKWREYITALLDDSIQEGEHCCISIGTSTSKAVEMA